eukprot:6015442-Pyramimonas_sp.AAC.1
MVASQRGSSSVGMTLVLACEAESWKEGGFQHRWWVFGLHWSSSSSSSSSVAVVASSERRLSSVLRWSAGGVVPAGTKMSKPADLRPA